MEIRRSQNIGKVNASSASKGEDLSSLGQLTNFIFSVFRRKKDKNKFSREEQILSGIIASDDLLDQVAKDKASKQKNGQL